MKRVLSLCFSPQRFRRAAFAATDPRTVPTQCSPGWQAKTRAVFKQAIEIPSVHNRGEMPRVAEASRRPVPRRRHPRSRHPLHALRGASGRPDRGADRPLAFAPRDQEADADPRPHGRGRSQARGLEIRPVRVPRGRRLFPRPRHQRHEERRRRHDDGRGQADQRGVQARPRHHLLLQRRRGDRGRRRDAWARPSGAT